MRYPWLCLEGQLGTWLVVVRLGLYCWLVVEALLMVGLAGLVAGLLSLLEQ